MVEIEFTPTRNNEGKSSKALQRSILILNFTMMIVGFTSGPLLLRLYFIKGGRRKWLPSWIQSVGFPIILIPLFVSYYHRRKTNLAQSATPKTKPYLMTPSLFLASTGIGILWGLCNFLFAYGTSYLPVSTSSLLTSTQLVFTAFFSFIVVRQKFTAYKINAVVLMSFGVVVLGLHSSGDRPQGEGKEKYYLGFLMMIGVVIASGLMLPLVELSYRKARLAMSYTVVMEMQMVIAFFATVFSSVGMVVSKDFQAIATEAKDYELGELKYYVVLVCIAIIFQVTFLGSVGVISYGSALLAGIIQAMLIPVTGVLALIFFKESFNGNKGVALGLSLWGIASYFYGRSFPLYISTCFGYGGSLGITSALILPLAVFHIYDAKDT